VRACEIVLIFVTFEGYFFRWVKFQEDVEDGGKRWSKPYVPALKLSSLMELKKSLEEGVIALNVEGRGVDEIVDKLRELHEEDETRPSKALTAAQFAEIKKALGHRVKLRMKLNLLGKMTSVAESTGGKSAPTSRQPSKESLNRDGDLTHVESAFFDVISSDTPQSTVRASPTPPKPQPSIRNFKQQSAGDEGLQASPEVGIHPRANSMSTSSREKSMRMVRIRKEAEKICLCPFDPGRQIPLFLSCVARAQPIHQEGAEGRGGVQHPSGHVA